MVVFGAGLTQFVGHFHPLLVHLPLGFIVLLAALEFLALSSRFQHLRTVSRTILVLSVPAALCAAITGWLLAGAGDYDQQLLMWHRWCGVGVASAIPILLAFHCVGRLQLYRASLGVTLVLIAITGHWGGSLTYGRDFLSFSAFNHKPSSSAPAAPRGTNLLTAPVYSTAIQPVFDQYCVSCHGPQKQKAKLRLDSHENLVTGSENGAVIEAGASERSPMIQRLMLPDEEDDHMPPVGKPQPSPSQIALLKWWVDAGAPDTKTIGEVNPPQNILQLLRAPNTQARVEAGSDPAKSATP